MAEEDLIFGKNRHMFGGIEPSNVKSFTISRDVTNDALLIKITLPDDTTVENQLLCTVAGAVIRRKTTGYPKDEFDGDFVADITASGTYTDSGASTGVSYYYAAFPYSTQGVYNRGYANRAKYTSTGAVGYYYGFDLDTLNSDPDTRVTYPDDVQNANYTPAKVVYDAAYQNPTIEVYDTGAGAYKTYNTYTTFNYGDWPSEPGVDFMPTPCVLNGVGNWASATILCDLDPNDYTKTADGSTYTPTTGARFMMRWPKIYVHREVENGVYKFRCSDVKIDDTWDCLCNYDRNNNEIDNFFTGIYSYNYTYGSSDKTVKQYTGTYSNAINFTNTDWNVELLVDRLLIQDLLIMMAKTTNLKDVYGHGSTGYTSVGGFYIDVHNRSMDKAGLFWGSSYAYAPDYGVKGVKVFGMENYWGHTNRLMNGLLIVNGEIKIKLTSGTHDGTTVTGYNTTGSGYLTVADLKNYMSTTGSYGGYISEMISGNYGRIPITPNGSSTTYEPEQFQYFYYNSTNNVYWPRVGGRQQNANILQPVGSIGPFAIDVTQQTSDAPSYTTYYHSYKPTKGTLN